MLMRSDTQAKPQFQSKEKDAPAVPRIMLLEVEDEEDELSFASSVTIDSRVQASDSMSVSSS